MSGDLYFSLLAYDVSLLAYVVTLSSVPENTKKFWGNVKQWKCPTREPSSREARATVGDGCSPWCLRPQSAARLFKIDLQRTATAPRLCPSTPRRRGA